MNSFPKVADKNNRIAIVTDRLESISYRYLLEETRYFSSKLEDRHLVLLLCGNNLESIVGYIGSLNFPAVPILLSAEIHGVLLESIIENYRPRYIFSPKSKAVNLGYCKTVYSFRNYVLLETSHIIDYVISDELAQVMSTSGSTGSRKFVRQSFINLDSNIKSIIEYLKIGEDDRAITTMPMNYPYGLSIITTHLWRGASVILNESPIVEKTFWKLLKGEKATTFGGVPHFFEMLLRLKFHNLDLPSLKYVTQAGGKLLDRTHRDLVGICERKGIEFIAMYGQTEACPRMSYLPWENSKAKIGSIGIPIPGGHFSIQDDRGNNILGSDIEGEIVYRGKNVALGYAEDRFDLAMTDDNNGVLQTGDIGYRDSDGFYFITGRNNRFVKVFGNRINLDELEELIRSRGYDCACIGIEEKLNIFITNSSQKGEISKIVGDLTGIHKNGYLINFRESIPRTESGKIRYKELCSEESSYG